MKKLLALVLLIAVWACDDKYASYDDQNCVRVRLIDHLCGQAVLKIMDSRYFEYGQDWNGDGAQLQNVFSTILPCDFDVPAAGDEFFIQFVDTPSDDNCARCKALLTGPEKFNHINVIDNCETVTE